VASQVAEPREPATEQRDEIADARRSRHKAVIVLTRGVRPDFTCAMLPASESPSVHRCCRCPVYTANGFESVLRCGPRRLLSPTYEGQRHKLTT
jgi:hypothetical protein